jgi:Na+-transporting NADH:ubiquinone oxidoreductase subunit NqrB
MLYVLGLVFILGALLLYSLGYHPWWIIISFHLGMCCISFAFMFLPKGYLAIAVMRSALFHLGLLCLFFYVFPVVGIDSTIPFFPEVGAYGFLIGFIGFLIPDNYLVILLRVRYPQDEFSSKEKKRLC